MSEDQGTPPPVKEAAPKPTTAPKRPKKSSGSKKVDDSRKRGRKAYPVLTFEEALKFGQGLLEHGAGHPMKRATVFEKLQLSINQATRNLITASSKYGITEGGHDAQQFKLTETGTDAVQPKASVKRIKARFQLGIASVPLFVTLYEKFKNGKMPALEVMRDQLDELDEGDRAPCVDIFVQNAKFIGLLQTKDGAEFFIPEEELFRQSPFEERASDVLNVPAGTSEGSGHSSAVEDFDHVCFFIAPIGSQGDEHRKHSDAILSSYVEKALADVQPKLKVVRADKIDQPGMISKQVVEYIVKSRLVVADLSYQNPNVFYELALRHTTGKPVIHLKRATDRIPFDTGNFRTIDINFEDKFQILAELETVRSTVATFARTALTAGVSTDNPILAYYPDHRFVKIEQK